MVATPVAAAEHCAAASTPVVRVFIPQFAVSGPAVPKHCSLLALPFLNLWLCCSGGHTAAIVRAKAEAMATHFDPPEATGGLAGANGAVVSGDAHGEREGRIRPAARCDEHVHRRGVAQGSLRAQARDRDVKPLTTTFQSAPRSLDEGGRSAHRVLQGLA